MGNKIHRSDIAAPIAAHQLDQLHNPSLNRGTAFTAHEREHLKLRGLLPPAVETLEVQVARVLDQLSAEKGRDLDKYFILQQLLTTNEILFYRVLEDNIADLLPIVYTPTVGKACTYFHKIFRAPKGMYFSAFSDRGEIRKLLDNWPQKQVEIVVVTDGGRILGLGDLGTNGMGISIGKIALYVAGGGFNPKHAMPVCLDVGTDHNDLRNNEFYLGTKSPRLKGNDHMEFVEEFCTAIKDKWPHCLIQFEDFKGNDAISILANMRDKILCFNDDIQGTGAVVLAGFINGMKCQGTDLKSSRVVIYGAGSSASGVASTIVALLMSTGISEGDANKAIYLVDTKGLVTKSRGDALSGHKLKFARDDSPNMTDLCQIVEHARPHALLGLSGAGSAFSEKVIKTLCSHCEMPLIFPLSNPTEKAEITAEDAYRFSDGKCIFAAGSPFDPVNYNGKTYCPGQANNVLIFPGVGFGTTSVHAEKIPDEFFVVAAKALANYTSDKELELGNVYPPIQKLREISATIAVAVAEKAYEMGIAKLERPKDIDKYIRERMYCADYSQSALSAMP